MERTEMKNPEVEVDNHETESHKGALVSTILFVGGVIVVMWVAVFWLFMTRI